MHKLVLERKQKMKPSQLRGFILRFTQFEGTIRTKLYPYFRFPSKQKPLVTQC